MYDVFYALSQYNTVQLITNEDRPPDSILHKVLIVSDMSARNQHGQTAIYKAIANDFSRQFIKALFKYGINMAARDDKGRTVRDYAEHLKKTKYFTEIDEFLIESVKGCDIDMLQQLVLHGYDHVLDITDNRGINVMNALKKDMSQERDKRATMLRFMEKIKAVQVLTFICKLLITGTKDRW